MDWHLWLGVIAGVIQFISFFHYAYSIIWGTTRPSFFSNFLWTTLGVIEIAAQWSAGSSWSIILVCEVTFNTALITLLAVIGYGYKKWSRIDVWCFVLACAALVGWYITGAPLVALFFAFAANFFASVPVFRKAYFDPYSEQFIGWFLVVFASICSILSTTIFDPANLLIQGYLLFESA
jgi:hypothetical protein